MNKMKKILDGIVLICGLGIILPNNLKAEGYRIQVNNEYLWYYSEEDSNVSEDGVKTCEDGVCSLEDETASYNSKTKTLTLNNYHGGIISDSSREELNIVLVGENIIDAEEGTGLFSYANLNITGEGSLTIKNADYAIRLVADEDEKKILNIKNTNLIFEGYIYEEDDFAEAGIDTKYYDINVENSKISFKNFKHSFDMDNGKLTHNATTNIINGRMGIYGHNNDFIVNGGKLDIKVTSNAILVHDFEMNDGTINADTTSKLDSDSSIPSAITCEGKININDGVINLKVKENSFSIIQTNGNLEININTNKLEISPREAIIKDFEMDLGEDEKTTITVIVSEKTKLETTEKLFSPNDVFTEVVIKAKEEVNPQTGDNIIKYIFISILSLIGIVGAGIYTNKKTVTNR